MKAIVPTLFALFLFSLNTLAQKTVKDSLAETEPIAVGEIGAAATRDLKGGKFAFGYNVAVEVTPIEDWLELELGFTPTFASHLKATDLDLLVKKPWTFSSKVEFMFGLGIDWSHTNYHNIIDNSASGEIALDFMFWPYKKHRIGWYLEPEYDYGFGGGHEQSLGLSGGLLLSIP